MFLLQKTLFETLDGSELNEKTYDEVSVSMQGPTTALVELKVASTEHREAVYIPSEGQHDVFVTWDTFKDHICHWF